MSVSTGKNSRWYKGAIYVNKHRHPLLYQLWEAIGEPEPGTSPIAHLVDAIEEALGTRSTTVEEYFETDPIRDSVFLKSVGDGTERERRNRIVSIVVQHGTGAGGDAGGASRISRPGGQRVKNMSMFFVDDDE